MSTIDLGLVEKAIATLSKILAKVAPNPGDMVQGRLALAYLKSLANELRRDVNSANSIFFARKSVRTLAMTVATLISHENLEEAGIVLAINQKLFFPTSTWEGEKL